MKTQEIKKNFLKSFENKGHKVKPSSSSIPFNDPTLLFVNAGMNQFKEYFLGSKKPNDARVATAQKCIRVGGKHNDLDNVGHTNSHLTFFEMLGNFSFGDYFKKEAIEMAFDVTVNSLAVPIEKLFISVYEEDFEAFELWKPLINEKQICFMGKEDNFWSMGDTGPCGPCSELYFDKGPKYGSFTSPKDDPEGKRFVEFWNLVFMEFNKGVDGKITELPAKSIDTGMGLERMSALLNNKENVFETNIFVAIIDKLSSFTNTKYVDNKAAFHVIADHLRCLSFAMGDGAYPSNVERGYVLRKVIRRAVRYARQLSINKPFLAKLVPTLIDEMGEAYPELEKNKSTMEELLTIEEENFHKTLSRGGNILQSIITKAKKSSSSEISGKDAFTLKDTYGFPIEEICLLAKDNALEVNLETFSILEKEAKEKSKKAHKTHVQEYTEEIFPKWVETFGKSTFVGYESLETSATIVAMLHNGEPVETLNEGQKGAILLDTTPFYAEMGGQKGDLGTITYGDAIFSVEDCKTPYPGIFLHEGIMKQSSLACKNDVSAKVCPSTRNLIEKNHTATHMLHYALEQVLGEHIKQAGSHVFEDGLRLDFTHHKKIEKQELYEIESLINEAILSAFDVSSKEMDYEEVKEKPSIKQLFGEKYGEKVRVVSVGDFSKELCGGTHVKNTSEIGLFKIIKETSISASTRRIEACTFKKALAFITKKEKLIESLGDIFATPEAKLFTQAKNIAEDYKSLKKKHKKLQKEYLASLTEKISKEKKSVGEGFYLIKEVALEKDAFAAFATDLLSHIHNGIVILANTMESDGQILIQKTKNANFLPSAKHLLEEILQKTDGKGGGSDNRAQGSFKRCDKVEEALSHAEKILDNI